MYAVQIYTIWSHTVKRVFEVGDAEEVLGAVEVPVPDDAVHDEDLAVALGDCGTKSGTKGTFLSKVDHPLAVYISILAMLFWETTSVKDWDSPLMGRSSLGPPPPSRPSLSLRMRLTVSAAEYEVGRLGKTQSEAAETARKRRPRTAAVPMSAAARVGVCRLVWATLGEKPRNLLHSII